MFRDSHVIKSDDERSYVITVSNQCSMSIKSCFFFFLFLNRKSVKCKGQMSNLPLLTSVESSVAIFTGTDGVTSVIPHLFLPVVLVLVQTHTCRSHSTCKCKQCYTCTDGVTSVIPHLLLSVVLVLVQTHTCKSHSTCEGKQYHTCTVSLTSTIPYLVLVLSLTHNCRSYSTCKCKHCHTGTRGITSVIQHLVLVLALAQPAN